VSLPRNSRALPLLIALTLVVAAGIRALVVSAARGAPGTLIAVGDIASCSSTGDEQTAALVKKLPGTIAVLGDIAYPNGSAADFRKCFDPSWGSLVPRIKAALGNHEYNTGSAKTAIAELHLPKSGWYSYDLGSWHLVVLNGNCSFVGGCGVGSPQWRFLKADLASHPSTCTLAYWHQPRFSSGLHGSSSRYQPFWTLLAKAKAELVLSGHDHDFERFAPVQGIRQFVVGTGGAGRYPILVLRRGSVVHSSSTYGVLRLTLGNASYSWKFLPVGGGSFTDTGSAACT
jgi:calcineurin-like phosphoesterase family protein